MKSIFSILAALLVVTALQAQVPQGISYQAIAFNGSGAPVVNGNVGVKISILDNSTSGTIVYSETHTKTTNAHGLFNLNIGQGSATSGVFSSINWGTNSKFLKVEVDPNGGTSYTTVGTNQLMSVPFAFAAASVTSTSGGNSLNNRILKNKSANFAFDDGYAGKVYVYNSNLNAWSSQAYDPNSSFTIYESQGNFAFNDGYAAKVYVYNGNANAWSSQSYDPNSSFAIKVDSLLGNFSFDDGYAAKVYAFNGATNTWTSQSYDPNSSFAQIASKGNIAFNDGYANKVYVYNGVTGQWSSQSYNPNSSFSIIESNGNFIFEDGYDSKVYVYSAATGTWSSQTYDSNSSFSIKVSEIE